MPKIIVIRPNCPFGSGIWSIQDLFTVNFPCLHPHRYAMAVDSFLLGGKVIRPYCISLLALLWISFLGPCNGICGLFIVSAPGKLCIYACLYRSNAHGNLPVDVPPALIQTTVTRTFARPAVNLCRLSQRKRPVQMWTCL